MLLAVGAALGDHLLDLLVLARMQGAEGEVLELPLERVDAEAVRDRRVHLERLARLAHLRLLAHVLDRPHVVKAVGKLDQDHPDVPRHRDHELAIVLGLRLFTARELHARQLRHALDEHGDLVSELGLDVLDGDAGVLDRVVEQRRGDRRLVHPEPGEDLRGAPRVVDELLPRAPHLPVMRLGGELERTDDQVPVEPRLVGLELGQQLVDKILMSLEYRHPPILPGSAPDPSPERARGDRKPAASMESGPSMFRRRRTAYRIRLAARLLLAIGRSA